jgi:hypothetical protein
MSNVVKVPYFDNAALRLSNQPKNDPEREALAAFLSLTLSDRNADSRHVYAYYRDYHHIVAGQDWLDAEMGIPETAQDIWEHVTPLTLIIRTDHWDKNVYVFIDAECAWNEGQGLMMVWRDGKHLKKVGGYDEIMTNDDGSDDPALAKLIYYATDPEFRTYADE